MAKKDEAIAIPTKQFFVSMLTRDINLADAILDLIDNCLDGALRLSDGDEVDYSKHSVNIILDCKRFSIEDDCGGISRDIAKNYAFKMGREPDDERDSESETIGMYGVGMKRAIFKMGRDAIVRTNCDNDEFYVPIASDWLDDKEWNPLPILQSTTETKLEHPGTIIEVTNLYPSVSKHFENDSFINDLQTAIGEHFTSFLQKGLKIIVNDSSVKPVLVEVLVSDEADGPAPYVYQKEIEGVTVSITVGLNTGKAIDDNDEESADFERNRSAATAGWTVFCNDRAVIVGDKSRLTGWGDGLPFYHYQFSVITGIVEFRSACADKLPITTTKRALDTSSDVWLEARTKMREGLRVWINHTNMWKNHPRSDQTEYWKSAKPLPLPQAVEAVAKRDVTKKQDGGIEYNPVKKKVLPIPKTKKPSSRRIVYSRPIEEIRAISDALFDRDDEKPSIVGDKCFELVLNNVREQEGNK
ncbi:MAG: hypothetical protein GY774_41300 [Planctomycetes bacterium]|nr:hypothetical protein [Planctomycetota bacterium]